MSKIHIHKPKSSLGGRNYFPTFYRHKPISPALRPCYSPYYKNSVGIYNLSANLASRKTLNLRPSVLNCASLFRRQFAQVPDSAFDDLPQETMQSPNAAAQSHQKTPLPPRTPSMEQLQMKRDSRVQSLLNRVQLKPKDLGLKFDLVVAIFKAIPSDIRNWNRVTEDLQLACTMLDTLSGSEQFVYALKNKISKSFTEVQRADLRSRLTRAQIDAAKEKSSVPIQIHFAHMLLLSADISQALAVTKRAANIAHSYIYFIQGVQTGLPEDGPEKLAKAEALYSKAIEIWPDNSEALTNMGIMAYYGRKNKESAIQYLQRAIKADIGKQNYMAHFQYALILELEVKDIEMAKYHYSKAIEINPKHSFSYAHLGTLLLDEGLDQLAHENFKKALEFGENRLLNYFNLANLYSKKGFIDLAAAYMYDAIKLNPNWAHTYYLFGNMYFNNKKLDSAVIQFKKAVELASKFPEQNFDPTPAINNLIIALRRMGYTIIQEATTQEEYSHAAKALREALAYIKKDDERSVAVEYMNLAYCYMKCKQPNDAINFIELGLNTGGPEFANEWMQTKYSESNEAIYEQLAVHLGDGMDNTAAGSPERARAHYNTAFCMFQLGDARSAADHLREAVSITPDCTSDYLDPVSKEKIPVQNPAKIIAEKIRMENQQEEHEAVPNDDVVVKKKKKLKKTKKLTKAQAATLSKLLKMIKLKKRVNKTKLKKKKTKQAVDDAKTPAESTSMAPTERSMREEVQNYQKKSPEQKQTEENNNQKEQLPKKVLQKIKMSEDANFDDLMYQMYEDIRAGRKLKITLLDENNQQMAPDQAVKQLLHMSAAAGFDIPTFEEIKQIDTEAILKEADEYFKEKKNDRKK